MKLRQYQEDLLTRLFQAYDDGFSAPCIVLPCGGGKSVITAEIAKRFTDKRLHVLFLVHRKELCEQIENTFVGYGVNMDFCKIMMVQTATRRLPRIKQPDLIITDENHHSKAKTYRRIYDYFHTIKRVGVTATPERMGGEGLRDVNDILIEGVTPRWLIDNHYLSDYRYFAPKIDLPKFHIKHGEYDQNEIKRYFEKNANIIYGDAVKHYRRIADGKQAICYLPNVEFSQYMAEQFSSDGITAAHIDGKTPKTVRSDIIERFRKGEIRILCNVDIISEGFDVPDCACSILLRPTKSLILFIQQSMRCMRYREGKTAIIIDHVNNVAEHGLPDFEREWSLDGHPKRKGAAPVKTCPNCFATMPSSVPTCPHCGHVFEGKERKKKVIDKSFQLSEINREEEERKYRVSKYLTPGECQNVDELKIYAKQHGYKPGWVWYQQKARGFFRDGNRNSKRYPCRPI